MSSIFAIERSAKVGFFSEEEPAQFSRGMSIGTSAILQGNPKTGAWWPQSAGGQRPDHPSPSAPSTPPPVSRAATVSTSTTARPRRPRSRMPSGKPNCGTGHGGFKLGNICGKGKRNGLAQDLITLRRKANLGQIPHEMVRLHALKDAADSLGGKPHFSKVIDNHLESFNGTQTIY